MAAIQRTIAFGGIAAASLGVVAFSYQQETAIKRRNSKAPLHHEDQGVLNPQDVQPLSGASVAQASQEASKLKHRNSRNYYGLMTGEYSEAKK